MIENISPSDIEKRSMEIISGLLSGRDFPPENKPVIWRAIHATADLEYADNLVFSENAVRLGIAALSGGCDIVTDTNMAMAGINKTALSRLGGRVRCFMADEDVLSEAKARGITRAAVSMERAARIDKPCIFAIGNAPTALIKICELCGEGRLSPALVIGVPVGFVNVVESKELLIASDIPHIAARGRKGGSGVAAAVVNALIYEIMR
ncbi:MAG: precorrin-8X methylmutase [Clostridia bacterium]|nr:precorrin-8X methylmutase [Clostridia bacterium]